jgi:hypothetical protein
MSLRINSAAPSPGGWKALKPYLRIVPRPH